MRNWFFGALLASLLTLPVHAATTSTKRVVECSVDSVAVHNHITQMNLFNCMGDLGEFKSSKLFTLDFAPIATKGEHDDGLYRNLGFGPADVKERWMANWSKGTVIDLIRFSSKAMLEHLRLKLTFDATDPKNVKLVGANSPVGANDWDN